MILLENLDNALVLASTYALTAVGLTMVYGVLRVLHIAHASIYTIGAFAAMLAAQALGDSLWLALAAGMLVSSIVGLLIYRLVYQRMLSAPRIVPLIASIGLLVLFQDLLQKDFLMGAFPSPLPLESGLPEVRTSWFKLTSAQLSILAVTAILLIGVWLLLTRTRLGLGWQATAIDLDMAASVGVNIDRVVALNFLVGSALAGAAGVLIGMYENSVSATMGEVVAYKPFIVIVLGGLGSVSGTLLASLLLAFVETLIVAQWGFLLPRVAIAFLVSTTLCNSDFVIVYSLFQSMRLCSLATDATVSRLMECGLKCDQVPRSRSNRDSCMKTAMPSTIHA
ncbi:MAG: branched-chain amino acid ABC transporter permease, partial [Anaerolineales bacterium]